MFGKPVQKSAPPPPRRAAAEAAKIEGGGLAQVIVTSVVPIIFSIFLNDTEVPQVEVESLSVSIEAPADEYTAPTVRATLNRYLPNSAGGPAGQQHAELFPCTLEIVALRRRLSITCTRPDSLENMWVSLGLKPDGTASDLSGLRSVRFLLTQDLLDAKITWTDGVTEDLLPQ